MKKIDIINGEELQSDLFGSFDPEGETWIVGGVGGSTTLTSMATYSPNGVDAYFDIDLPDIPETQGAS